MKHKIYLSLASYLATGYLISLPVGGWADCRPGLFTARVCTTEVGGDYPTTTYYHRHYKQRTAPRPTAYFPTAIDTQDRETFVFDPKQFAWAAYRADGQLIKTGPASGGQAFCPDVGQPCQTPSGEYSVYRKGSASCKSSQFPIGRGGAPMPYCMYFTGGYAIHGSSYVPPYNASHGCVRVVPADAEWLSKHFVHHGTRVIILPYH